MNWAAALGVLLSTVAYGRAISLRRLTNLGRGRVPAARSHPQGSVTHFHSNGMPPTVAMAGTHVSEVVLLAQFIGDARRRRVEIPWAANDFSTTATAVGNLA